MPIPKLILTNAVLALCAVSHLQPLLPVSSKAIHEAMLQVTAPGRCQQLHHNPTCIIDVAHNAQAATHLANFVSTLDYEKLHIVYASLEDKNIDDIIRPMTQYDGVWHICSLSHQRAASYSLLQQHLQAYTSAIHDYVNAHQAISAVIQQMSVRDLLIVYGSFHLIGEVSSHPYFADLYK